MTFITKPVEVIIMLSQINTLCCQQKEEDKDKSIIDVLYVQQLVKRHISG